MQIASNHKRRLRHAIAVLFGGSLSMLGVGCVSEGEPDAERLEAPRSVELDHEIPYCTRLMAGQHHHAGWVCLSIDHHADTSAHCGPGAKGKVVVSYETHDGWELYEEHMHAGTEHDDIPTNNGGNPKIGHFDYHHEDEQGHTQHSFYVPLCHFGLDDAQTECEDVHAYFAAHAVVKKYHHDGSCQEETAWGEGPYSFASGWAMVFDHELECKHHEPC